MGRKPRRAPRDVPDSLPKRDEGTDVLPDDVRSTDAPQKGRIRRPYVRSDKTKSRRFAYCAYLSENLDRPLPTKDGGTLRTIHAACDDMTSIGNQRERRQQWQRACNLILA